MNWNERGAEALAATMASFRQEADHGLPAAQRLRLLAQSLSAMVQQLESELEASADEAEEAQAPQPFPALHRRNLQGRLHASPDLAELALRTYRDRRRRAEIFGDETLFGEPAWDILLDLFVAGEKGKRVAVTSACIGSGVPSTTALRWLNVLEMRNLVEREEDLQDARRSFVRLTPKARDLIADYFTQQSA